VQTLKKKTSVSICVNKLSSFYCNISLVSKSENSVDETAQNI